jgi:hypothetical protein
MLSAHHSLSAIAAIALASCATPCHPRITQAQAIRIGKQAFVRDWGKQFAPNYPRWTAQLEECTWLVIGHTPPDNISGDANVKVDAQTGKAVVGPIVQTDKEKLRHMKRIPAASNQAMKRIATD